jgi:hypothetical protein
LVLNEFVLDTHKDFTITAGAFTKKRVAMLAKHFGHPCPRNRLASRDIFAFGCLRRPVFASARNNQHLARHGFAK